MAWRTSAKAGSSCAGGFGFYVQEELVFPGAAVDGAAFDFLEVDAVFGKGFEGGEESTGAVCEAHGDGHFACVGSRLWGFGGGAEEHEAGEILGVVLDVGSEDDAGVVFSGAAARYGCAGFVAASQGFADAAGGVFGGDSLQVRMGDEEAFALSESHGMTRDGADRIERGAGAADEVMLDGEDGFGSDVEGAFEEKIVDADNWAGEGVFYGGEESVGQAVADGAEGGIEGGAGNGGDSLAEELDSGFFAEGAGLALESYAHFKDDSTPQHEHRVRRFQCGPGRGSNPHWLRIRRRG